MPRAVILTARAVEYLAVRSHLRDLQEEMHPQGAIYQLGKFVANGQKWEVGVVETGGKNADVAVEAERAITYFKPDVLLFVGIAGGIKDVEIGDVVAATLVYGYESGKVENQFYPRPILGGSTYALLQRARAEARKVDWLDRLFQSDLIKTLENVDDLGQVTAAISSAYQHSLPPDASLFRQQPNEIRDLLTQLQDFRKLPEFVEYLAKDLTVPESTRADLQKILHARINISSLQPHVVVSPIAAGEKVIASMQSDVFSFIRSNYSDAIAVDMEGYDFLRTVFDYPNIKSIVIRGISDLIDVENDVSLDPEAVRQEKACRHASAFAFELLAKLRYSDNTETGYFSESRMLGLEIRRDTLQSQIRTIQKELEVLTQILKSTIDDNERLRAD